MYGFWKKVIDFITDSYRIIKAIICRLLYFIHAGLGLWSVNKIVNNQGVMYFLYIIYAFIPLEGIYNLKIRAGKEYKWWSPVTLFYLLSIVPSLLILEIYSHESRGALQAYKREMANYTFYYQFTKSNVDHLVPFNQSFISNYVDENCPEIDPVTGEETGGELKGDFCQCLSEEYYKIFTVNLGELMFKPIEHLKDDLEFKQTLASLETTANSLEFKVKSTSNFEPDHNVRLDPTQASLNSLSQDKLTALVRITSQLAAEKMKNQNQKNSSLETAPEVKTTASTGEILLRNRRDLNISTSATEIAKNLGESTKHILEDGLKTVGSSFKSIFNQENYQFLNGEVNSKAELVDAFLNDKLSAVQNTDSMRLILHQTLLFVLVIGRWILPKGKITDAELSQLLLVFIGVAADIIEFITETIDDDSGTSFCNTNVHYAIWFVWTWSLTQFVLVLTASKTRKVSTSFDEYIQETRSYKNCCGILNNSDLWGMCITLRNFLFCRLARVR